MHVEQRLADNRLMRQFLCERIPADGTRIVVADGSDGGPAWADLYPSWDDEGGWDLRIETNDPEWIGLKEVYDHFRRQEMTWGEWCLTTGKCKGFPLAECVETPCVLPTSGKKPARTSTLTVGDTAALLGCSYGEARKRMLDGRIRTIKDGRWIRTRSEWVDEYIARQMVQAPNTDSEILTVGAKKPRKSHVAFKKGGMGYQFLKERQQNQM